MSLSSDIRAEYKAAGKELVKKIDKWTKQIAKEYERQLAMVKSGAISEEAFKAWYRGQVLHSSWAKSMSADLVRTMQAADAKAAADMAREMPGVYAESETATLYKIDRLTGLGAGFKVQSERAVAAAMADKLLPGINAAKNAAWNSRRLNSAITQGIIRGEAIPKIAKRIAGVATANSKAAIRNARTAVNAARNAGAQAAYEEAAAEGIKITKIWLATLDDRTRDSHVEMDGEEVGIDEEFSNGLKYPCDPDGAPEEVWNCRCTMVNTVNGQRVDTSGRINKTGMSYEEWKNAHKR